MPLYESSKSKYNERSVEFQQLPFAVPLLSVKGVLRILLRRSYTAVSRLFLYRTGKKGLMSAITDVFVKKIIVDAPSDSSGRCKDGWGLL
ncbi:MAG: hypothetical protein SPD11_05290 [Sphaerochaetaceae bacterium]|nr:hypothetical protein [Sphaerochaetaceae bacterium]